MNPSSAPSRASRSVRRAGRTAGNGVYSLSGHDWALLAHAMRCAQKCDELLALVETEGWLLESAAGPLPHPAVAELRRQQLRLTRLLAALRHPLGGATAGVAKDPDLVIQLPEARVSRPPLRR